MSTQAAIFDLDDTLYLERDYVRSGYRAVGEHLRAMGRTGTFERWLWARFERGQAAEAQRAADDARRAGRGVEAGVEAGGGAALAQGGEERVGRVAERRQGRGTGNDDLSFLHAYSRLKA